MLKIIEKSISRFELRNLLSVFYGSTPACALANDRGYVCIKYADVQHSFCQMVIWSDLHFSVSEMYHLCRCLC